MRPDEIAEQLSQFAQDPKAAINQHPPKRDERGQVVANTESAFDAGSIADRSFVTKRDTYRQRMSTRRDGQTVRLDQVLPGKAPFLRDDRVEDLIEAPGPSILRRLEDIEGKNLRNAKLAETPWSSSYWPIYQGVLGARYADKGFPGSGDWKENHDYHHKKTPAQVVASGDQAAIDRLSPSEKYDLLVGDPALSLTEAMWREGKGYYDRDGKVETWMGICHGWAPAAYMAPRPRYKIRLTAADGKTKLTFFPDDLKALACLLWAKTNPESRFIGGRCNDKDPKTDENGRVISQDAFDTNPGTWHLCAVNQIGVLRRSFVLDATYDYEVWNQPVYSYQYTYFNPQTQKPAASLKDATIARAAFAADKFRKYRSDKAASFVGVAMEVAYVVETRPDGDERDDPSKDRTRTARYLYDLELDASGLVIGGEWYQNLHPDFLWTPPQDGQALSVADAAATGEWSGSGPLPAAWLQAARSAARHGQPLAKLVRLMLQLAAE